MCRTSSLNWMGPLNWILKRLQRITLTTTYLPEIDGLRFIAISAVILCHIAADLVLRHGVQVGPHLQWLDLLIAHGERGVHLFFTISGFILALPFAKRYLSGQGRPDLKRYFRRRLFRLEPPYFLNVVILTIATWIVSPSIRPVLMGHFLAALTYTHLLVYHYVNPINMIWWSLEIETQFYILMPLLALVFKIRRPGLRRGILIAAAIAVFVLQNATESWIVKLTILANLQFFLAGLLAADLYQSGTLRKQRGWTSDALGFFAAIALFALPGWWRLPGPAVTFLIITATLNSNLFRKTLSLPWISATGSMCYTIYLWHVFVMAAILKLTLRFVLPNHYVLSLITQVAIIVPAIFFFSVALFLALEKPCMQPEWPTQLRDFIRRTLKRSPASVSEVST